jgi:hypothetical protein
MTEGSDMIYFKSTAVRLEKNHLLVVLFIVMWTALYIIGKTGACLC